MSKLYEGHQPTLEDFWANLQDRFEGREKYYHRLTVPQIRDFGIETNLPQKLHDNGVLLDLVYKEMGIDKRSLPPIRWSQQDVVDIDTISLLVIDRTKKWLSVRIKPNASRGKQNNIPIDNPQSRIHKEYTRRTSSELRKNTSMGHEEKFKTPLTT